MIEEVEAKLLVPDPGTLERMADLEVLGPCVLEALPREQLRTLYLDTPDHRLTRAGVALRVRQRTNDVELTLKLPGIVRQDVHRRPEWTVRLDRMPGFPWDPPAGELRQELERRGLQGAVGPLVETKIDRRRRRIREGQREVGEMALDAVILAVPDGVGRTPEGADRFFEVELELGPDGRDEDLGVLVDVLRRDYPVRPSRRSKLERALRWAGFPGPDA